MHPHTGQSVWGEEVSDLGSNSSASCRKKEKLSTEGVIPVYPSMKAVKEER
jgi:hypothetical protein